VDRSHHKGFAALVVRAGLLVGNPFSPPGAGYGALQRYGNRRLAASWWISRLEGLVLQLFSEFWSIVFGFLAPRSGLSDEADLWIRARFCGFGLTASGTFPSRLRTPQRLRVWTGWTERSLGVSG
jgi:hypothetical protein